MPALWALLPIWLVAFIWLRLQPSYGALIAREFLFIAPLVFAVLFGEWAYRIGPAGIERRAWGLLAITTSVLALSESYYGWYQLTVSPAGPRGASAFDALNVVAACLMLFTIVQLAGVGRLDVPVRLRLVFDSIAFSAVTFIGIFHFVVEPLDGTTPWGETARWAAYSLVGVLILMGMLWIVANARGGIEARLVSLVGIAVGVFALGMLMWPIWRVAASSPGDPLLDGAVAAVYLAAYYLLMMAALTRVWLRDKPWRLSNLNSINTEGVWATTLLSLYVLVGVGLVGWWLYAERGHEPDTALYVAGGLLAIMALVARTAVTAIETVLTRSAADLDPVTGILGGASFLRHSDEAITRADRQGEPLTLIVFDMDSFSQVNAALGHSGGDRVLTDVAEVVARTAGDRGAVFRVAADEFALICPVSEPQAMVLAAELLAVIRGLSPADGITLSASVGVAGCDVGECERDELVWRANSAQAWAKYHGKGRVVRFDERIVRALGVEERLRVKEDDSGLDMARALTSAADARDPRNYYHSRNVAALSVLFAESLELEPARVRGIEIAAMLHDCGKLGLPDSLLVDVLRTSRQQLAVREHAAFGGTLAVSLGVPGVPDWIRHHHERWDGAGYPDGLSGDGVPLESRIIALADAYDAMTSGARNRSPMSRGAALQEIDLGMGSRFDPLLAEQFIEVVGLTASLGWSDEWAIS